MMPYIDSTCGCCKKRKGIHTRECAHKNRKDTYSCVCPYTHTSAERSKARSLMANNNNTNNKKEAWVFLDSPCGAVKRRNKILSLQYEESYTTGCTTYKKCCH